MLQAGRRENRENTIGYTAHHTTATRTGLPVSAATNEVDTGRRRRPEVFESPVPDTRSQELDRHRTPIRPGIWLPHHGTDTRNKLSWRVEYTYVHPGKIAVLAGNSA